LFRHTSLLTLAGESSTGLVNDKSINKETSYSYDAAPAINAVNAFSSGLGDTSGYSYTLNEFWHLTQASFILLQHQTAASAGAVIVMAVVDEVGILRIFT